MLADRSLHTVARAIHAALPDLGVIEPVRVLGDGFRSVALETANGIVVRVAKHAAAAAGYAREVAVLPYLRSHLPVAIPEPVGYVAEADGLPFGCIAYRKIGGVPLQPSLLAPASIMSIAADMAEVLIALHRVPPATLPLPPSPIDRAALAAWRDETLPALHGALTLDEFGLLERWWDVLLADPSMDAFSPVVQHGDLWYENVLIDPHNHSVIGVIDWEQVAWGDPAQDFATQFHAGMHFAEQVIEAYLAAGGSLGSHFEQRLRWHWQLRELDGVRFALRSGDRAAFAESVGKLRRGPIFSSRTRLR